MDLTEMLSKLVTDLKMTLDTEITTAEGTRAIERAVEELSRHIPREAIYEHTWVEAVTDDTFTTPITASDTVLVNAYDISASVDGATATMASKWLDLARPVKVTITDANNSITSMTVIVKGLDPDGLYKVERFYRYNGKVQTGKQYFTAVTEVEIHKIAGNGAADTLSIGTDSPSLVTGGVWVQLDNLIEPESELIYSGASKTGTKYTRDTDYEMDYANGKIRMKYGTTMAVNTVYYASYDRAPTAIDISDIIPELLRIVKVLYPVDKVPEQSVMTYLWNNKLVIGSPRPGTSQEDLTDGEHLAIYYEAKQYPPTVYGPGTYPEFLDEVVIQGAGGFALLMEALQYELQAVTDLASMRTELSKVATLVTATTGKIDIALTKVATYLESSDTTDNAKDVLANVTDNIADLRAGVETALDGIVTNIGLVFSASLDKATTGGEAYLDTGDDLINRLNDGGPDVGSNYAAYANIRAQLALARVQASTVLAQEAQMRLDNLRTYLEESAAWMKMGDVFINEAQVRVAEVNGILLEAQRYQEGAGLDLLLSDRYRAEAESRLAEFRTTLASKAEYRKRTVTASVRQPA